MSAKPAAKKKSARAAKPAAWGKAGAKPEASLKIPEGVLLGAHTSASGGVTQAVTRALGCGFTAAQIFVKNNKQWFAPALSDEEAAQFRAARKASGIYFFAHNSYLINLGSQDEKIFSTSVQAMIAELKRAEALELPFIVMHPGSHGGMGEEAGLKRIAHGLDEIARRTPGFHCRMALEITAGQGKSLGYRFEHLHWLIENVREEKRFGTCLDTAHLHAAGYNLESREGYEAMMDQADKLLGINRVLALHLNDSKVPCGKRVDRHAHLGEGTIGIDCFKWIAQDARWKATPKVLETPKSEDMHEDIENLQKLASYLQ
ncbi:MAG TPA: deoxyribonuclease IV [Candidatus Methylacidiphilales bacterium]|nr:deoxyribonuclease IV [Candidatus Methylacidiphilales bacterium]